PKCETRLPRGAKFCLNCGQPMVAASAASAVGCGLETERAKRAPSLTLNGCGSSKRSKEDGSSLSPSEDTASLLLRRGNDPSSAPLRPPQPTFSESALDNTLALASLASKGYDLVLLLDCR